VKEKVLAAHRAGITTILLPERNRKDVDEIPPSILAGKSQMHFHFVREMGEAIALALLPREEALPPPAELQVHSVN
jgi:ATP-dependent Lon protease